MPTSALGGLYSDTYATPGAGYYGFGNNSLAGSGGFNATASYDPSSVGMGNYLDPGQTGGNAIGILMAKGMTAAQAQAYIAQASSGNSGYANFMHGLGQFVAGPATFLYNHTFGQLPGATQSGAPNDAFGAGAQSLFNWAGGYQAGNQGVTPFMPQVSDQGQNNPFIGAVNGLPAGAAGSGSLFDGGTMPAYPVNESRFGNYQSPGQGATNAGAGSGGTPGNGFDPWAQNALPPFPVNESPYNPGTDQSLAGLPPSARPIDPTGIDPTGGGNSGNHTLPDYLPINPPQVPDAPSTTPPGTGGGGGSGAPGGTLPTGTGSNGDRNAYPEGLAQIYAQGGLAPQQLGLYGQYAPAYAGIDARTNGQYLFGQGGPSTLAGQAAALNGMQQDPLLQQQNRVASQQLGLGGQLSPSELRNVQQNSRAGFAARGLDATNASVVDESMQTDAAQRNRLLQSMGMAQNVVGQNQNQSQLNNAFTSTLLGMGQNATAASNQQTRAQFDPFNNYGMDLANTNYNAGQARNIAGLNASTAMNIADKNADAATNAANRTAAFNLLGTFLGRCWVAREVFGVDNPEWLKFRVWLDVDAPKWFMRFYVKYGPRIAAYLKAHPYLKPPIRAWMRSRNASILPHVRL